MSENSLTFVLVGETLVNVQTVCAATLVTADELHLWFPGSSQTEGPSFTIYGPEARELWTLLKQSARSAASSKGGARP